MARFCFSAFADEAAPDLAGQTAALLRCGIRQIEPRSIGGPLLAKSEEELTQIRRCLDGAGITVSSYGSPIGKSPIDAPFDDCLRDFEKALTVCRILGTARMRIFGFYVAEERKADCREEVMRRLAALAERADAEGITLCVENETAVFGQNPPEMRDILATVPRLRGIFDAANYVQNDADPLEGLAATLPSLGYLHAKDMTKSDKRMQPAGEGDGAWTEVIRRVDRATDGLVTVTLEPHLCPFDAYAKIDLHPLRVGKQYDSPAAAFDAAAAALKNLFLHLGFTEENGIWKK